jgi:hypothetical protein
LFLSMPIICIRREGRKERASARSGNGYVFLLGGTSAHVGLQRVGSLQLVLLLTLDLSLLYHQLSKLRAPSPYLNCIHLYPPSHIFTQPITIPNTDSCFRIRNNKANNRNDKWRMVTKIIISVRCPVYLVLPSMESLYFLVLGLKLMDHLI